MINADLYHTNTQLHWVFNKPKIEKKQGILFCLVLVLKNLAQPVIRPTNLEPLRGHGVTSLGTPSYHRQTIVVAVSKRSFR